MTTYIINQQTGENVHCHVDAIIPENGEEAGGDTSSE